MTLVGVAGVVAVLLVVLSIGQGLQDVMQVSGAEDAVIAMRTGSDNEMSSSLDIDTLRAIAETPGIRRDTAGALLSAELVVVVDVPKASTGTDGHVPLRGVQPAATQVRDGFRLVRGRMFEAGKRELIVGRNLAAQFSGLQVGAIKQWGENRWTVVGVFAAAGSVAESEIWADLHMLQAAYGYGSTVQSVHARLDSAETFATFAQALAQDVRTGVSVARQSDFYGEQAAGLTSTLNTIAGIAGLLMGMCAAFGALNTMYTAVSARAREIAILRAMGFSVAPTVVSVLTESLVVAAVGGLLGVAIAYAGFNGIEASTMNWATYTQVGFAFHINAALAAQGVGYALAIGFVGGLFPALRVARLPVAAALREA